MRHFESPELEEMVAVSPNTESVWVLSMLRVAVCAPTLMLTKPRLGGAVELCAYASERATAAATARTTRILHVFVIVLPVNG